MADEELSITFKNLNQEIFVLSFPTSTTIVDVKKKVETEKGVDGYEVSRLKLIYNGKVLEDDVVLADINYDTKKFIVAMVSRKKEPVATQEAPAAKAAEKAPESTSAAGASSSSASQPAAAPATEKLDEATEQKVESLIAMGYDRASVVQALKAAFFNSERAVEYLISGIPEAAAVEAVAADAEPAVPPAMEGEEALTFLRNSPPFAHICQIVRDNPALLPSVLQEFSESNPELFDLIRANQQAFLQLLNEGVADDEEEGDAPAAQAGADVDHERGAVTIAITAIDRDAIQRVGQVMVKAKLSPDAEAEQAERREYVKNIGIEYRYGCYEEKKADTCHVLGEYMEAIEQNFAKALTIFRDNCDERKFPRSCFKYATYLLAGKECEPSLKKMVEPLEIACNGGIPPGCRYLSLVHWNGEPDREPDSKKAEEYMRRACEMEDAEACWLLSTWYIHSDNMQVQTKGYKKEVNLDRARLGKLDRDMNKALKYAELACDLNIPQSCVNAARILKLGDGVPKDLDRAKLFLDRAKAMADNIKKGDTSYGFTG